MIVILTLGILSTLKPKRYATKKHPCCKPSIQEVLWCWIRIDDVCLFMNEGVEELDYTEVLGVGGF